MTVKVMATAPTDGDRARARLTEKAPELLAQVKTLGGLLLAMQERNTPEFMRYVTKHIAVADALLEYIEGAA